MLKTKIIAALVFGLLFLGTATASDSTDESEARGADIYADNMWMHDGQDKYQLRALVTGGRVERNRQKETNELLRTQNELLKKQNEILEDQVRVLKDIEFAIEMSGGRRRK